MCTFRLAGKHINRLLKKVDKCFDQEEKKALLLMILKAVADLQAHQINPSVLKVSGILEVLKKLKEYKNIAPELSSLASQIRNYWKQQVHILTACYNE